MRIFVIYYLNTVHTHVQSVEHFSTATERNHVSCSFIVTTEFANNIAMFLAARVATLAAPRISLAVHGMRTD